MARILAIDADPSRKQLFAAFIRAHLTADLTIVDTVHDAVATMGVSSPDVVLVPTLLSPSDERELMAEIGRLDAPYVQTLTIPALELLADVPREQTRRFQLRRHRTNPHTPYEPAVVAAQIAAGLERARIAREEHERKLAHPQSDLTRAVAGVVLPHQLADGRIPASAQEDRRRARRIVPTEVPWLSAVRMPWGLDLDLVNISSTGLLVGSGSKLSPGVTYEMQLQGPETAFLVKATIVRTDVARVDGRGVKYYSAATFERALDVLVERETAHWPNQQSLAELLLSVVTQTGASHEPADVRFARGLRQLVRARDVLVRKTPIAPSDGSESFYFHVKGEGPTRRILQVLFDPDRALTETEFRLLKAAAPMTAAVLELDRGGLLLPEAMPQVA